MEKSKNPNQHILDLWNLPKEDFNKWRRKNDLPNLFAVLRANLPHFEEWLEQTHITELEILDYEFISNFFTGKGHRYYSKVKDLIDKGKPEIIVVLENDSQGYRKFQLQQYKQILGEATEQRKFLPYFEWLNKRNGTPYFTPTKSVPHFYSDITFNTWQNANTIFSQAFIFSKFPLLKLGGVQINSSRFDGRNLDFVDLDNLHVRGGRWGDSTSISYSSCRNLRFDSVNKSFISFEKCYIENFSVTNSQIQDFHFLESSISGFRLKDSRVTLSGFSQSYPSNFEADNCDFFGFYFVKPPVWVKHDGLSELYRRFRLAFEQKGRRREVSEYYYLERSHELLGQLTPFIPQTTSFPTRGYAGGYGDLYKRWRSGQFSTELVKKFILGDIRFILLLIINPFYWARLILSKGRALSLGLDCVIWGFGEKPWRVFGWMAFCLSIFTAQYYFSNISAIGGDIRESLSCAAYNFATMGCEHKIALGALHGITGAILIGVMVAGFSNRSRY